METKKIRHYDLYLISKFFNGDLTKSFDINGRILKIRKIVNLAKTNQ